MLEAVVKMVLEGKIASQAVALLLLLLLLLLLRGCDVFTSYKSVNFKETLQSFGMAS